MDTEIKEAILELIKKDRKIHEKTEAKLDRQKNKTSIYKHLEKLYKNDVEQEEIKNKDIIQKYGLLDKEHLIEYIRYKYIGMKIDDVGVSNSIGAYELFKYMIEGRDPEIKEYMYGEIQKLLKSESHYIKDKDMESYLNNLENEDQPLSSLSDIYVDSRLINNMFFALRNINITNQAKFEVINNMIYSIEEDGEIVRYIESILKTFNLKTYISKETAKELIETYLRKNKPGIPLHNIEQATHLYKVQNLDKNIKMNKSLKLLRSSKTSSNELNFSSERKLMDYLYEEIQNRPGRLKNMQYYILERSMGFEMKKIILRTVNEIEKTHKGIHRGKEILKIRGMKNIKDIYLYKKLGQLYVDEYPDYGTYIDVINTVNNIISKWINNLEMFEMEGYIQKKDILEEISLFPRLCNSIDYRNDYGLRNGFCKEQYQVYNRLKDISKNEEYSRQIIMIENNIHDAIKQIILYEGNKRR